MHRTFAILLSTVFAASALAADRVTTLDDAQLLAEFESALTPGSAPLEGGKCLFPHVLEMQSRGLRPEAAAPLQRRVLDQVYLTPDERFRIEYAVEGDDALDPLVDADESGVPDYVEWVAEAFQESYQRQVVELGYPFPEGEPYLVQLRPLGGAQYGVTYPQAEDGILFANSRIVVNAIFGQFYRNFPQLANQDPEGNVRGAIRVTVAHEFKHALQVWSRWDFNPPHRNWVELDAVWMEEVVYDQVNDYYNYLTVNPSPFTAPDESLFTNAFYEYGTWQVFLEDYDGIDLMLDLNTRRSQFRTELFQNAYLAVAQSRELDWARLWGDYAVANYLTGDRADPALLFEEGMNYPLTPTEIVPTIPYETPAPENVEPWAMVFHQFENVDRAVAGRLQVTFDAVDHESWGLSVVFQRIDEESGDVTQTVVVPLEFSAGTDSFSIDGLDVQFFDRVALVVGNGRTASTSLPDDVYQFTLDVDTSVVSERSSFGGLKKRF